MSHLRNLLYNPSGHEQAPLSPSVATAPGHVSNLAKAPTAAYAPAEFPVEEAQLRPESRIVFHSDPRSPAADRYRLLRMKLKTLSSTGKLKKILVTSPLAHDGKTTVTLNLATALAERGKRRVLLIEADLHNSSLADILSLRQAAGLSECLVNDSISPLAAIRRIEPLGWNFLAGGEPRRNPTELLQTPAFGRIMEQLSSCFDWILIDSPPIIPLTDSISLQQHADASLLVVRAGRTPREAVEKTIELLGKKNIIGVVLNGMEARDHLYYQYYDGTKHQHDED